MAGNRALLKADIELNKEIFKNMDWAFFATCLVLNRDYGYKQLRLERFLEVAGEVYRECGSTPDTSLVQMCDEEVGIEFRTTDNDCYKDAIFPNSPKWHELYPDLKSKPQHIQIAWHLRVKQVQIKWAFPQIMASIALALYRKEGWGLQRVQTLCGRVTDTIAEYNWDRKAMQEAVEKETGVKFAHTKQGELAVVDQRKEKANGKAGSDKS